MDLSSSYIRDSALLYVTGVVTVIYVVLKLAYNLYTHFVIYFTPSAVDFRRFGRWALVTGSTDGIGKGIARQLAKMGLNILLVSRNTEKLRKVTREIESEFRVETQYVAFDFTTEELTEEHTSSVYDVINDAIRDLDIGILVNNVGMFTVKPSFFLHSFASRGDPNKLARGISDLINCNDVSMAMMTQLVLPGMIARKKGLIINISSLAASLDCPFFSLYAASKKFNDAFSKALSYEVEHDGVIVQSIQPALVQTNMSTQVVKFGTNLFYPTYEKFASCVMRTIGKDKMTHGYWAHALQTWALRLIPEWATSYNNKLMRKYLVVREEKQKGARDKKKKYM